MNTGLAVLKTVLMPESTFSPSALNSGPRWSITGMSMARRMRSGTGVGPGICRKWRPARRGVLDMVALSTIGCNGVWAAIAIAYCAVLWNDNIGDGVLGGPA